MDYLSRLEWILRGDTKNERKKTKGIRRENDRKHSTNKESITQVLDHRKQMVTHDPKSTKVRIQREPFFSVRRS